MGDILKGAYKSRDPLRKTALCKQLLGMEKKTNITMMQYLTEFASKAEQIRVAEVGIEISNKLLSIIY